MSAIGLAAVLFAGPAAACNVEVTCDSTPVWTYGWDHANTVTASLKVDAKSSGLCAAVTLQATSYTVPGTWNRNGFNQTAVPQTAIPPQMPMTFPIGAKSSTQTSILTTPPCGPYQVDLYGGAALESIDINGTPDLRAGGLVDRPNCPIPVVPVAPTWTPGTCQAEGTVTLVASDRYAWSSVETADGTVYTATAIGGNSLTTQGPWTVPHLAQLSPDNPDCLPAVLPVDAITEAQMTPTPPTCDVDGSLTLVNGEGYTWAEPLVLDVGTHEVTATADDGWVFAESEPTATFDVVVLPATGVTQSADPDRACYLAAVVPSVDPPAVIPPAVILPVVDPPAAAVASTTPTVSSPTLAYTGFGDLPWLLVGAAGLIGLGALTVTRTRARRVRVQTLA
ncbi:MAG: hypothetical protein ACOH2F_15455 [Cellulomonas sp.]